MKPNMELTTTVTCNCHLLQQVMIFQMFENCFLILGECALFVVPGVHFDDAKSFFFLVFMNSKGKGVILQPRFLLLLFPGQLFRLMDQKKSSVPPPFPIVPDLLRGVDSSPGKCGLPCHSVLSPGLSFHTLSRSPAATYRARLYARLL